MLSYYTKRSKGEGFHKTSAPHEYTSWIHGSGITREELDGLISRYNLTPNIVHDVRDVHELPRVEYGDKGYLYMFLRVPRMTKRGEVETSPLLAVVRGRVLLTLVCKSILYNVHCSNFYNVAHVLFSSIGFFETHQFTGCYCVILCHLPLYL